MTDLALVKSLVELQSNEHSHGARKEFLRRLTLEMDFEEVDTLPEEICPEHWPPILDLFLAVHTKTAEARVAKLEEPGKCPACGHGPMQLNTEKPAQWECPCGCYVEIKEQTTQAKLEHAVNHACDWLAHAAGCPAHNSGVCPHDDKAGQEDCLSAKPFIDAPGRKSRDCWRAWLNRPYDPGVPVAAEGRHVIYSAVPEEAKAT